MTRRGQARYRAGWAAIGTYRGKTTDNLGSLWRSAVCLGASYVFTVDGRYHRQPSDTIKSERHVPIFNYTADEFRSTRPHSATVVGVELTDDARPLETFVHPECALYLLGPEDGSLSTEILDVCDEVVAFSSRWCLNVAAAGSIVLYDRQTKVNQSRFRSSVLAEHASETRGVVGSSPTGTTIELEALA